MVTDERRRAGGERAAALYETPFPGPPTRRAASLALAAGALSGCPPEGDRGLRRARQQRDDPGQVPGFFVDGVLYFRRSVIPYSPDSRVARGTLKKFPALACWLIAVNTFHKAIVASRLDFFGARPARNEDCWGVPPD
jgi:hypothetical protein